MNDIEIAGTPEDLLTIHERAIAGDPTAIYLMKNAVKPGCLGDHSWCFRNRRKVCGWSAICEKQEGGS